MKDWKERFNKEFDKEYPSVRSYTAGHLQEWVINFIEQLISERDKELIESVEKMKLLEVGVDSNSVMWKQRINKNLENIINLIKTK